MTCFDLKSHVTAFWIGPIDKAVTDYKEQVDRHPPPPLPPEN